MFENWQKLVSTEKISILFLRISILHSLTLHVHYRYRAVYAYENMFVSDYQVQQIKHSST